VTGIQFGGLVLGVALAGIVRGVIRPRYQAWVVRQVQIGRWTERDAMRFDHRINLAIWMAAAFVGGMGAWWWIVLIRHGIAT
jgi:hypothetical protein